jgi:hypothetical protein
MKKALGDTTEGLYLGRSTADGTQWIVRPVRTNSYLGDLGAAAARRSSSCAAVVRLAAVVPVAAVTTAAAIAMAAGLTAAALFAAALTGAALLAAAIPVATRLAAVVAASIVATAAGGGSSAARLSTAGRSSRGRTSRSSAARLAARRTALRLAAATGVQPVTQALPAALGLAAGRRSVAAAVAGLHLAGQHQQAENDRETTNTALHGRDSSQTSNTTKGKTLGPEDATFLAAAVAFRVGRLDRFQRNEESSGSNWIADVFAAIVAPLFPPSLIARVAGKFLGSPAGFNGCACRTGRACPMRRVARLQNQ